MDKLEGLIGEYLPFAKVMQLATCADNQPWACTVHYYSDDRFNLYWCSTQERRHSKAIKQNQKASATILIHENNSVENYIIGISVEGVAELLEERVEAGISKGYQEKHHKDPILMSDIANGKNSNKFYRLTPSKIVLFDTNNFSNDPRQELNLGAKNG